MDSQVFSAISIRGRVAYLIICLERAVKYYDLNNRDWLFLLELLWNYTSTNVGAWHENMAECIPRGVLNDTEDLSDLEFLTEEEFWRLNGIYKESNSVILELVDLIFLVGINDLYSKIVRNSPETLVYIQKAIELMNSQQIQLPSVKLVDKFTINENRGWGRAFTRGDVFSAET